MMDIAVLRENLLRVGERVASALVRAGREDQVQVVAVTKGFPAEHARTAILAGLRRIGENRVPELEEKVQAVGRDLAEWHMVGHLQRNKVRRVLPLVDLVHSVDSERLAATLSKEALRLGSSAGCLVQVNVSGEETKHGLPAEGAVDTIGRICEMPGLDVRGLMTMAPLTATESLLRKVFAATRELFYLCGKELPEFTAEHLSMGMSNDFEEAILEGANMVRLGTVIFGERKQ